VSPCYPGTAGEFGSSPTGVFCPEERFSYQYPVDTPGPQSIHFGRSSNPAFRNHGNVYRDTREEIKGNFEGGREGLKVSIVDPYYPCTGFEGPLHLILAMDLYHGREAKGRRLDMKCPEIFVRQDPCNQKGPVSPGLPSLQELDRVQHEVFSEHGDIYGPANLSQVVQRPSKVLRVGKHTDRGGAGIFIGPGQLERVQLGADGSGSRRATLHLRHQGHFPASLKGQRQIPGRRRIRHPLPKCSLLGKESFYLFLLGPDDLVEDAGPPMGAPMGTLRFGQRSGILYSVLVRVFAGGKGNDAPHQASKRDSGLHPPLHR